jgi:hypothetical protein
MVTTSLHTFVIASLVIHNRRVHFQQQAASTQGWWNSHGHLAPWWVSMVSEISGHENLPKSRECRRIFGTTVLDRAYDPFQIELLLRVPGP